MSNIDSSALFKIGYGLYVICSIAEYLGSSKFLDYAWHANGAQSHMLSILDCTLYCLGHSNC